MSKKRKDDSQGFDSSDQEETPVSMEVPAPVEPEPAVEADKPEVLMTFDRWFSSTGRPIHHKAGMLAFVGKVKGKRPATAWAELFKAY